MAPANPVIYETLVDLRFSDFDPYGHLNAPKYLDLVLSSRWKYKQKAFDITQKDYQERGLGFYLMRSEIDFKKSVENSGEVLVRSHVEELKEPKFRVDFEIRDTSGEILHAAGNLTFVIINIKSGRPTRMPEWCLPYLFRDGV